MEIWAKSEKFSEGKFLVVRRDGTIPAWPHFVLGARDPWAPRALKAYASAAAAAGADPAYVGSIRELAQEFESYREHEGDGDPEAPPHRKDNPIVVGLMGGRLDEELVRLRRERENQKK